MLSKILKTKYFTFENDMRFILIFWFLNLCWAYNFQNGESCVTPYNVKGTCISLYNCPHFINILNTTGTEYLPQIRKYLIAARCQNQLEGEYKICCAKRGYDMLNEQNCGKNKEDRIANGINATLRQFPWMALLKYNTEISPFKCGGSLITNRYVLSAAHCVVGLDFKLIGVRLGELDISKERDCQKFGTRVEKCNPPVEDFAIEAIKSHPEYDRRSLVNDISLIKLDTAVTYKVHIKPICLPITATSIKLQNNQIFHVAGWGTTETGVQSNVLQYALLTLKERSYCSNIFKRSIIENHICALGENNQDTCRGDSGGPLFAEVPYKEDNKYVQYGVVSFGVVGCGASKESYPGVYANILDLLPWIIENIT